MEKEQEQDMLNENESSDTTSKEEGPKAKQI